MQKKDTDSPLFEELDYRPSPIGTLILRRRRISVNSPDIYEIKLNEGYLMSSQFTAGEVALAEIALEGFGDRPLDVVVGGLGLGYTAKAALDCANVRDLLIIEAIPEVVEWHQRHLVPLGKELAARSRFAVGDFFAMAARGGSFEPGRENSRYDAILVDIDHSPRDLLHPTHASFYEVDGLKALADKLVERGVFALWSTDKPDSDFIQKLEQVFDSVEAKQITFANPYQERPATNTVYRAVSR
jgi:spermidine synthase